MAEITKGMTKDTARALEAIRPLADELGVRIDADMCNLYIENTTIGIYANSTYATVMEALGYIFITQYPAFRRMKRETLDDLRNTENWCWAKEAGDD